EARREHPYDGSRRFPRYQHRPGLAQAGAGQDVVVVVHLPPRSAAECLEGAGAPAVVPGDLVRGHHGIGGGPGGPGAPCSALARERVGPDGERHEYRQDRGQDRDPAHPPDPHHVFTLPEHFLAVITLCPSGNRGVPRPTRSSTLSAWLARELRRPHCSPGRRSRTQCTSTRTIRDPTPTARKPRQPSKSILTSASRRSWQRSTVRWRWPWYRSAARSTSRRSRPHCA